MVCSAASRISSDHWASMDCGIGNRNRMDLGWPGSRVVFIVGCGGGCSRGMCMMALTPLWSRNVWCMVCVSLLCGAM